jgi:hypothetical protein
METIRKMESKIESAFFIENLQTVLINRGQMHHLPSV